MQKAMMDFQNFRKDKGQKVKNYTQEFRKGAFISGMDLSSQDTLLKYIGGLHSYLRHIIFMFNCKKLDEVCVQVAHLEARAKNVPQEGNKKSSKSGDKGRGEFKGKGKKNSLDKKEGEKLTCEHCSKEGDDEDHYWKLHPEMTCKNINSKEKQNIAAITQYDLGFVS